MSGEYVAFFILAFFALSGAVFMLSFTKVIHMIFAVAFSFLSIAGLYVLLSAEFVAVVQILVYTGAVTILAAFGIMMTRHDAEEEGKGRRGQKFFSFLVVLAFLLVMAWGIQGVNWGERVTQFDKNNVLEIGQTLFNQYMIPFELVSVLLLVALIGAVIMAKEDKS
ncbi:NADH-quinone oxidoreductase chain J [[Clostridium] ultunense Esp]|nr:NADH-quinone oxidoreductase chain J [[Clostridium] ultunense Esp]